MTKTPLIDRLLRALCAAGMLALLALPAAAQDPLAAAVSASDAAFAALKQGVAAARDTLRALEQDLSAAPGEDRSLASVRRHHAALAAFATYADKTSRAGDAANELPSLRETLRNDLAPPSGASGPAAANAGRYARQAGELAAAADRLHATLDELREKGRLASPAAGGENDVRYRRLVEKFGKELDPAAYLPSSPREVFRASPSAPALIWDEAEEEWYRVDGNVPVETIFREAMLASGRRPSPGQLKVLAENFPKLQTHRAAAESFAGYVQEAAREGTAAPQRAYAQLPDDAKAALMLADPTLFRIKYVYDAAFRTATLTALDALRQKLGEEGAPAEAALRELDAATRRHGITLDSQWAQGAVPAVAEVRVVAWFADNPKEKFTSTWKFEKEKVTIALANGYAHGTRTGDVVRTEGSIPGRNCIAADERTFAKDGKFTFSSVYTCTLEDGSTQINNRAGEGTWQVVAPQQPKPPARARR